VLGFGAEWISERIVEPANGLGCMDWGVLGYLVTWLNILNTIESLSECSSLSSVSHACARHGTARDAATPLALQAVQMRVLSPAVTSFPLVFLQPSRSPSSSTRNVQISG
jgi:hypothetical protein